mgnify:CR=1 FL=1
MHADISTRSVRITSSFTGTEIIIFGSIQYGRPEYAAMLFDAKGPTFRHERYEAYKANRPPMAEEMAVQIPLIQSAAAGAPALFDVPRNAGASPSLAIA